MEAIANGGPQTARAISLAHPPQKRPSKPDGSLGPDSTVRLGARHRRAPDEGGHQADVVEKARACGIDANVSFLGAIPDEEKWTLYRSSDLFVLPTFSENFGVVVAEALASGIPVITTTGAPWEVLETADCGWWVDIGVDPLVDALREAMAVSDAERVAMGQRGRALVQERFTWKAIAETLHAAYLWLHHPQAPRPEAVIPENQPVRCT